MASQGSRAWLVSAIFLLAAAQCLSTLGQKKILHPYETPPIEKYAVFDITAIFSGVRRFGADVAFIQFLHFIAQPMEDLEGHSHPVGEDPAAGQSLAESDLAQVFPLSLRSVYLDPYFHYSYLFGSGFLAFYLNRYPEALELVELGIARDPTYWRFRLYAGAIGYKSRNQTDKVIPLLEEAVQHPDCPTMVANILGNLYEAKGDLRKAADVYRHILETSRDEYDLFKARQKLDELRQKHGI